MTESVKFGLAQSLINIFANVFTQFPEVEQVIIYGSRAMNKERAGSDIDLVLKGQNINQEILDRVSQELDLLNTPYLIDLCNYHTISNLALLEHIDQYGQLFYWNKGKC